MRKAIRIVTPTPRPPVLSPLERNAYQAAHSIMQIVEYGERNLVCPGAIRTRRIDKIAEAIMDAFQHTTVSTATKE